MIFRLNIVGTAPQITAQPVGQSVFAGANILFNVAVFGSQPLVFQWRKNGADLADGGNISGSSSRVLSLNNVSTNDAGTYSLFVSNSFGFDTSIGAFLQVTSSPPFIVQQPTNQSVAPGVNVVIAASAAGNLPLAYQWQKNGTNLVNGGNVSGANQDTVLITSAVEPNNGTYSLVVSNSLGSITSSPAILNVIPGSIAGTRLTTLYSFAGGTDGDTPNALFAATNGVLYGTTRSGGSSHEGTVFMLPPGGSLTYAAAFRETNGAFPYAGLI